jgi:hypothetical protein
MHLFFPGRSLWALCDNVGSQSVMGHLTCEQDNFSCTCPIVTKLGMYTAYGDPNKPIYSQHKISPVMPVAPSEHMQGFS